jgi:hypothetical protein
MVANTSGKSGMENRAGRSLNTSAEFNYVGAFSFSNSKRSGQGTLRWADGTKYVGEFRDDLMNGQGTYTSAEFNYVGGFSNSKFSGQGTYSWANGTKYVGEFRDNLMNGQGTMFAPDGSITNSGTSRGERPDMAPEETYVLTYPQSVTC